MRRTEITPNVIGEKTAGLGDSKLAVPAFLRKDYTAIHSGRISFPERPSTRRCVSGLRRGPESGLPLSNPCVAS